MLRPSWKSVLLTVSLGYLAFWLTFKGVTLFAASEQVADARAYTVTYSAGTTTRQFEALSEPELRSLVGGGVDVRFLGPRGPVRVFGFGAVVIEPKEAKR